MRSARRTEEQTSPELLFLMFAKYDKVSKYATNSSIDAWIHVRSLQVRRGVVFASDNATTSRLWRLVVCVFRKFVFSSFLCNRSDSQLDFESDRGDVLRERSGPCRTARA